MVGTKDLKPGMKFNRLTAIKFHHRSEKRCYWTFRCECGMVKVVGTNEAIRGVTKSCGCYKIDWGKRTDNKFRQPHGIAARNALYKSYQNHAIKRQLEFSLTVTEFTHITKSNCHYCGIEPLQEVSNKNNQRNGTYIYNGVDRINNGQGYFLKNCVPCCGTCNLAKRNLSLEEFTSWIDRLIKYKNANQ